MEKSYEGIKECYYRVSAKALIKNSEWKILLWKEKVYWDLPGGWVDHWEDIFDSIHREIIEETWVTVRSISPKPLDIFLCESSWIASPKRPLCIMLFEVILENLDFKPSQEFQDFAFFDMQDALENIELYHPNKKIFEELIKLQND